MAKGVSPRHFSAQPARPRKRGAQTTMEPSGDRRDRGAVRGNLFQPRRGFWVRLLAISLVFCFATLAGSHVAGAEPQTITKAAIAQAQLQAQTLQQEIQQQNDQVEQLVENYNAATIELRVPKPRWRPPKPI